MDLKTSSDLLGWKMLHNTPNMDGGYEILAFLQSLR